MLLRQLSPPSMAAPKPATPLAMLAPPAGEQVSPGLDQRQLQARLAHWEAAPLRAQEALLATPPRPREVPEAVRTTATLGPKTACSLVCNAAPVGAWQRLP
mmetsp:Transcript_85159/g.245863  ORF Transcript_85159/g.245863 Transcript_85159/m.245863 type:complete len:101 (-) Transcript_85159:58-360(-)